MTVIIIAVPVITIPIALIPVMGIMIYITPNTVTENTALNTTESRVRDYIHNTTASTKNIDHSTLHRVKLGINIHTTTGTY